MAQNSDKKAPATPIAATPDKLKQLNADLDALVKKANEAIGKGEYDALYTLEGEMKKVEKTYQDTAAIVCYDQLANEPKPYEAAIKRFAYTVIRHKVNNDKDSGDPTSVEIVEKERQIDLLEFAKRAKLDTSWSHTIDKFNLLLTCRVAQQLGKSAAEIKQLSDAFVIKDAARQIEMGKTPTSNTQLCKCLQQAIDVIIFNDDGKGVNTYKCNNHDVGFMLEVYSKKGKGRLAVATAKSGFMRGIIMTVAYRILTDGVYDTECKLKKS